MTVRRDELTGISMIVTVASYKGGVGKTTTALHIAGCLQKRAPTLLIDGDVIRAATMWRRRGAGFDFEVEDGAQAVKAAHRFKGGHIVIDTEANPSHLDFETVVESCDLLVIPAVPEQTATDGLIYTLEKLKKFDGTRYRVLITKVPPKPQTEGDKLRELLNEANIPVFDAAIPRLKAFDTASAKGLLVCDVNERAALRGWEAYENVGKEIFSGK